jgi:hypothetical protein
MEFPQSKLSILYANCVKIVASCYIFSDAVAGSFRGPSITTFEELIVGSFLPSLGMLKRPGRFVTRSVGKHRLRGW